MRALPAATGLVLVLAVLLGGGTRQGYIGDVIVQVAASFLFVLTLWQLCEPDRRPQFGKLEKTILAVAAALCLVQVMPVFPFFGVRSLTVPDIAGDTLTISDSLWSRISLTPQATWAGLTSAIVPVAIFMAVTRCDVAGRLLLWRVLLCLGGLALLLGLVQILQGPTSPLRFFRITNNYDAVGFFANRNHFAAHLYVTLALTGVWIASTGRQVVRRGGLYSLAAASTGGAVALLIVLTAGLAMAKSRAGVLIAMVVVVGIAAMAVLAPKAQDDDKIRSRGTRAILLAVAFATLLAVQFGIHLIVGRFQVDIVDDLRRSLSAATFGAAWSALPFGTGIGSFVRVYGAIEDPSNLLVRYANRAHNDLAEFLLETGVLGAALVVLFLIWFAQHTVHAWSPARSGDHDMHLNLQRAATVAIGGLLLHALVDYGLRTTAISALFAFACGVLTQPRRPEEAPERPVARRPSRTRLSPSSQQKHPVPALPPSTPEPTWGAQWPDEWKPQKREH